jgi:hypothetical protein
LDPVDPDMHGVGSSGVSHTPQVPYVGPHKPARTQLFRSPPSTPLGGSHNTYTKEVATHVGSRGGDGDEADLTRLLFLNKMCDQHDP